MANNRPRTPESSSDEDDRGSGGWSDEPREDEQQAAQYDADMDELADRFQYRMQNEDWCACEQCIPVEFAASGDDLNCCQECDIVTEVCQEHGLFGDDEAYSCITQHPHFYHTCLYRRDLEHSVAVGVYSFTRQSRRINDQKLRYAAYRRYTVWIHGYLGRFNRKQIPQCATKAIKRAFPEEHPDRYTGFQEAADA